MDTLSQSLSLSTTEFNFFELVELYYGVRKVQNVVCTLQKAVQAHKEGICGQLPATFSLGLVLKISIFKFGANLYRKL